MSSDNDELKVSVDVPNPSGEGGAGEAVALEPANDSPVEKVVKAYRTADAAGGDARLKGMQDFIFAKYGDNLETAAAKYQDDADVKALSNDKRLQAIGVTKKTVNNHLRAALMDRHLPKALQKQVTLGHRVKLLAFDCEPDRLVELAQQVVDGGLTSYQLKGLIEQAPPPPRATRTATMKQVMKALTKAVADFRSIANKDEEIGKLKPEEKQNLADLVTATQQLFELIEQEVVPPEATGKKQRGAKAAKGSETGFATAPGVASTAPTGGVVPPDERADLDKIDAQARGGRSAAKAVGQVELPFGPGATEPPAIDAPPVGAGSGEPESSEAKAKTADVPPVTASPDTAPNRRSGGRRVSAKEVAAFRKANRDDDDE